ncbi:TIGR03084 family metal-binding protein [Saccharothrix longispora]|uniref:TIGR03084 family metal-binding protein n=1 Tax=Saccharothrix longispora TaxID=33920 RepID=UPI0028FD24F4|nr:TIGR03084 family metal-binding protein [Saccharothrix longispora]MBY8851301.1 TIGR03084 family protein [Saccharothrix sp. MB29]MDU0292567.1 TIGR03084 family metal-binding protein [Saccharothrix longispora]
MITGVLDDLRAESGVLDDLVADADWSLPTPAAGWTIAHQISHLRWTDRIAALAARDPDAFAEALRSATADLVDEGAREPVTLDEWRAGREELAAALLAVPPGAKVPWFGPPMSPTSMATARLMETWAHGQDVADALGVVREPTRRLRHVAHIAVRAFGYAFLVNGLPVPEEPVRVELTGPGGEPWAWGPEEAADRITGPALDFCLLATQRRHRDDLAVTATGPTASAWLPIAQAFAGPPGPGRERS